MSSKYCHVPFAFLGELYVCRHKENLLEFKHCLNSADLNSDSLDLILYAEDRFNHIKKNVDKYIIELFLLSSFLTQKHQRKSYGFDYFKI